MSIRVQGYDATINRNVIQRDTDRMLVFYWYQSPDRVFASEYKGQSFSWFGTEYRGVTQADRSSAGPCPTGQAPSKKASILHVS